MVKEKKLKHFVLETVFASMDSSSWIHSFFGSNNFDLLFLLSPFDRLEERQNNSAKNSVNG